MNVKKIAYLIITFLLCSAVYMFGRNLHGDSAGINSVGDGITASAECNRELQEQLIGTANAVDKIKGSIRASSDGITGAEAAAGAITDDLEIAGASIAKCQRIIADIKKRAETGTGEP